MQWLKEIPSHWEERKMKYCFSERSEKNHPDEPILCATQSQGVIPQSMYANRVVVVNKGFEGLKLVKEGDFVISLRSFEGGIEYAYYQGIISAAYTVLQPNSSSFSNYWKILFKSHPFIQLLQTCVTGIREGQNINYSMLCRAFLPLPPLSEQKQIVRYLEDKTSKIDAYVSEKEKEILLLQELKQKTIADAVTKGLNPDVKTKDSGISWIGEIPEHWEVKRVGSFLRERKEKYNGDNTLGILSLLKGLGIIPYEEKGNIGNKAKEDLSTYKIARKGDVVVNCMNVIIGSSGITDYDGYISPAYYSFIPIDRMMAIIYKHWLSLPQMQGAIRCMAKGILEIRLRVSSQQLLSMKIPFPPLDEQRAIVSYIEEKCQKIDSLTTELQSEIDYLKEYKQRLIADCVTGQVNVQKEVT